MKGQKLKWGYNRFYKDFLSKVHIFWEGHKFLRNLHCTVDLSHVCSNGQIYAGDFENFCGVLRRYELYIVLNDIHYLWTVYDVTRKDPLERPLQLLLWHFTWERPLKFQFKASDGSFQVKCPGGLSLWNHWRSIVYMSKTSF